MNFTQFIGTSIFRHSHMVDLDIFSDLHFIVLLEFARLGILVKFSLSRTFCFRLVFAELVFGHIDAELAFLHIFRASRPENQAFKLFFCADNEQLIP